MLKINNEKILRDLAVRTYRANLKKNILTIIAIFFTTFLIATVLLVGSGYYEALTLRQRRMNGMDYDIALTEPTEEQVAIVRSMDKVKYAGVCVKCAILESYDGQELDKVRLYWIDDTCFEKQLLPALKNMYGSYPTKENEILLSKSALKELGIQNPKVGMQLPLTYGTLKEGDTSSYDKEFVLSGYFVDYSGQKSGYVSQEFYESTGVKQTDFTQGTLRISLKNPLYSKADILEMNNALHLANSQVIDGDDDAIVQFLRIMAGMALFLLLVFSSGYLFIYNIQYISVSRYIRYYGQLKTLGTTSLQLRKLVNIQLLWNALAGITMGIIASTALGKNVLKACMKEINPGLKVQDLGTRLILVMMVAAGFSLLVAFLGSRKPRKMVEDYAPVEAMKYIGGAGIGRFTDGKSKNGSLFAMSKRNLFRDKKQFVIIILSLSIAIALFLITNSVIMCNNARYILDEVYDEDMKLLNLTLLEDGEEQVFDDELISEIEAIDGIKRVRQLTGTTASVPYQKVYEEYYKELYASRYTPGDYDSDMTYYKEHPEDEKFTCRVIGVDDAEFELLNASVENPLDEDAFRAGEVCFFSKSFTEGDNGITGHTVDFSLEKGNETMTENIQVGAMLDYSPAYYAAGYTPDLIVSKSYIESLLGDNALTEMLKIEYEESYDQDTEQVIYNVLEKYENISVESKLGRYDEMKQSEDKIRLLGNTIAGIILVLALLNYINMMSASLESRKSEFAILESIGMTQGQQRKMIAYEAVWYAVFAEIFACVIGFPLSYMAFCSFKIYDIPFCLPIGADVLLAVFLPIFCVIFALWIFVNRKQMSIVEVLKNVE